MLKPELMWCNGARADILTHCSNISIKIKAQKSKIKEIEKGHSLVEADDD